MTSSKKPKGVSFKFLNDFSFENGVGEYASKSVCIMSGAALAVLIAEGKANLGDISRNNEIEDKLHAMTAKRYNSRTESFTKAEQKAYDALIAERNALHLPAETDHVSCVSPHLQSLLIERNDATSDEDALKTWALATLPKILGTKRNKKVEAKALKAGAAAAEAKTAELLKPYVEDAIADRKADLATAKKDLVAAARNVRELVAAKEIDTYDVRDAVDEIEYQQSRIEEIEGDIEESSDTAYACDYLTEEDRLAVMDAQIAAVLKVLKAATPSKKKAA